MIVIIILFDINCYCFH